MKKITVLIAEDFQLIREVWQTLFNNNPRFQVVGACESGEEAFEIAKLQKPDIVLADINLKGMDGFELTKLLNKELPSTKILAVSMHIQISYVQKILRLGASGYVTKNSPVEELIEAVTAVHNNQRYICEEIRQLLASQVTGDSQQGTQSLSLREMEVINHIKMGHSSVEIAELLQLSRKTVEVHRYNIMRKLNVKNTAALINHMNTTWQGRAVEGY